MKNKQKLDLEEASFHVFPEHFGTPSTFSKVPDIGKYGPGHGPPGRWSPRGRTTDRHPIMKRALYGSHAILYGFYMICMVLYDLI